MMLKDKFVQDDALRNRRRLGPLAWIGLFIAALFVVACVLGYYALVTRNVLRLQPQPVGTPTTPAVSPTLVAATSGEPTGIKPSGGITWTVWAIKNPIGETIYDGTPDIKAWVMRDYQSAQKWKMDHLFDRDYLLAHLSEYFADKALDKERKDIQESFDSPLKIISAPLLYQSRLSAPMDQPIFNAFSEDGQQMNLSDFNGSDWKFYDTRTRKLINAKVHKGTWSFTLAYDAAAARWKIARLTLKYDLDDDRVTFLDQIFLRR